MYFRVERNLVLMFIAWLCGWARLVDGIVNVLSLGMLNTNATLTTTKWLAKLRWRYDVLYRQAGKRGIYG